MALDWKFDQKTAGAAFIAVAAYQSSRGSSLPSLYDMQREDDSSVSATRIAQAKSVVDGLIIGVGASLLVDSLWPIAAVLTMISVDAVFYQWALMVHANDNATVIEVI